MITQREFFRNYRAFFILLLFFGIFLVVFSPHNVRAINEDEENVISASDAIKLVNEKYIPQTILELGDIQNYKSELWVEGWNGSFAKGALLAWRFSRDRKRIEPYCWGVLVGKPERNMGIICIDPFDGHFKQRLNVREDFSLPVPPDDIQINELCDQVSMSISELDLPPKLVYLGARLGNFWFIDNRNNISRSLLIRAEDSNPPSFDGTRGNESILTYDDAISMLNKVDHIDFLNETNAITADEIFTLSRYPPVTDLNHSAPYVTAGIEVRDAYTPLIGEVPYYDQLTSSWCWAFSLAMQHQWWSSERLGNGVAQATEFADYLDKDWDDGAPLWDVEEVMSEWQKIDRSPDMPYERYKTIWYGEGNHLLKEGSPTGYTDDIKTWLKYLGSPVIVTGDTTDDLLDIVDHDVLVIGYNDDFELVYINNPGASVYGASGADAAVSYSDFNEFWSGIWDWDISKRGMCGGIPGDNDFINIGTTDVSFQIYIYDNELELVSDIALGATGDSSSEAFDCFGDYYEDGVSITVDWTHQQAAWTSWPIGIGGFEFFRPDPPNQFIEFCTHEIPKDASVEAAYFYLDPKVIGDISVDVLWWVIDEDDRWHVEPRFSVSDDRDTSLMMWDPVRVERTTSSSYSFRVLDDDDSYPTHDATTIPSEKVYEFHSGPIRLQIDWEDPSGIYDVMFKYAFREDHVGGNWTDWLPPTGSSGSTYWHDIPRSEWINHLGRNLDYSSLCTDDDDDRPDDRLTIVLATTGPKILPSDARASGCYGDTIHVWGSDVPSLASVDLYWDSVKPWDGEEGLLNSSEAKEDGTYEVWFNVPEAVVGSHRLWVQDFYMIPYNETDLWGLFLVEPKLMLSPSCGLEDDVIYIHGYGFSPNANIVHLTFGGEDLMITVATDSLGSFSGNFTVPDVGALYGDYEVYAEDEESLNAKTYFTAASGFYFKKIFEVDNVRMIYPSDSPDKPLGCGAAWVSDWLASSFICSKLTSVHEGLDTDSDFVDQTSGYPLGDPGTGIITFGGQFVNPVVKYAESHGTPEADRAPVKFYLDGDIFRFQYRNGTNIPGAWLPQSVINVDEDMFIIENYRDGNTKYMMLCYGFGWKGTYAAGKYFDREIYPNLESYPYSWVIVHWDDTNGDGFVNLPGDGDTYTVIAYSYEDPFDDLLEDSEFDESDSSVELRTDGVGQDWYESRDDAPVLLFLSTEDIGGDASKKAGFTASYHGNAYLTQEFSTPQTDCFTVQWDIYVKSIFDTVAPDRAGWVLIGDDTVPGGGPNQNNDERFVYMAFYKPDGGESGPMDLVARDRDDEWSSFTTVATGLSLTQWYTIKVVCDVPAGTYDVYVDGVYKDTVTSRNAKGSVTHISFAQWIDGVGAFYVDNVYAYAHEPLEAEDVLGPAWTDAPPAMDGVLSPDEWEDADTYSGNFFGAADFTVYVMNDATNLYMALEVQDDDAYQDTCYVYFDNDNSGDPVVPGDDIIAIYESDLYDRFWFVPGNGPDIDFGGTVDGSGCSTRDASNNWVFEFSHPLDSDDNAHDFSLSGGDVVGFTVVYTDKEDGFSYEGYWPGDDSSLDEYGDIVIASPS